ncbi:MAG: ATP-binding cassette domain-containing protein [Ignavibacteria bacterium]|nr:ATP-binding cassette domain-containing protein [Ignavibacteria bacterium]
MQTENAIHVRDLVKVYNRRHGKSARWTILARPSSRGITGLLGPNGAGKSTLLKILTTLLPQSSGRAEIMGFDVAADPLSVRRSICLVLQQNAVEQYLTVEDNFETFGFHGLTKRSAANAATA